MHFSVSVSVSFFMFSCSKGHSVRAYLDTIWMTLDKIIKHIFILYINKSQIYNDESSHFLRRPRKLTVSLTFTTLHSVKSTVNFCGLLRKHELYLCIYCICNCYDSWYNWEVEIVNERSKWYKFRLTFNLLVPKGLLSKLRWSNISPLKTVANWICLLISPLILGTNTK